MYHHSWSFFDVMVKSTKARLWLHSASWATGTVQKSWPSFTQVLPLLCIPKCHEALSLLSLEWLVLFLSFRKQLPFGKRRRKDTWFLSLCSFLCNVRCSPLIFTALAIMFVWMTCKPLPPPLTSQTISLPLSTWIFLLTSSLFSNTDIRCKTEFLIFTLKCIL